MLKFGCRQGEGLLHADKDPRPHLHLKLYLHPRLHPHLKPPSSSQPPLTHQPYNMVFSNQTLGSQPPGQTSRSQPPAQ